MKYQKLFDHMSNEYGLQLVGSEMQHIIHICNVITGNVFKSVNDDENIPESVPLLLKSNDGVLYLGYYLKHKRRGYGFYNYAEPDIEFLLENIIEYKILL